MLCYTVLRCATPCYALLHYSMQGIYQSYACLKAEMRSCVTYVLHYAV